MRRVAKIDGKTVREDFDDPVAVLHYARAAHFLGLWQSERRLIERFFPDRRVRLLEAGCGSGRVTLGLWELGYRRITAFDFSERQLSEARGLAEGRGGGAIRFVLADATRLEEFPESRPDRGGAGTYQGVLFMFNGLMQIPGRENRRRALEQLSRVCVPGAPILFTTHDRDRNPTERALWRREAGRWDRGRQDPRLIEFGDRYFEDECGRTFMHLPDRKEILEDLRLTGWRHEFDSLRREVASESRRVHDFSDECRFWAARRMPLPATEACPEPQSR